MKKFKLISAFFAIVAALSFSSCENETLDSDLLNLEEEQQETGPAVFKVDFGGQTYVATTTQAQVQGNAVSIIGMRGTAGEAVNITIPGGVATGTYTSTVQMYVPSATNPVFYVNTNPANGTSNGTVTITNINTTAKTISGTFSFTGHYSNPSQNLPSVAFTNGSFQNIPYTGNMPNPGPGPVDPNPQPQTQYFKAKINGAQVDFTTIMPQSQMGMLVLSGTNPSTQQAIQIMVNANVTAGTYSFGMAGMPSATLTTGGAPFMSSGGTLTIISNSNGWIKGNFSFNGTNPMTPGSTASVTEGSFNVDLP